jgi:predicted enzyme related to lactoylglutathione lyase
LTLTFVWTNVSDIGFSIRRERRSWVSRWRSSRVYDLDSYLDRAEQLGGKRLVPPTDLPGDYGRFAIFTDPDGNQVGLWS